MAEAARQVGHIGLSASLQICSAFMVQARRVPDKTAIRCEHRSASYRELAQLVCRWSNAMAAHGVERGDHIAVMLPNDIEFVALILVAADLGAVLVPLSLALTPTAICKAFATADVKHVVATAAVLRILMHAAKPNLSGADGLWLSIDEAVESASVGCAGTLAELLCDVPLEIPPLDAGREDDALILSMTSGSTGHPKPIILTQSCKFNRVRAAVELYAITERDRVLAATPLYHSLAERLVLIPLLTGATSVLMPRFSPSSWLHCVSENAVTFTIAVSSQLKQIALELNGAARAADISSLRCVVSSSALLDGRTRMELMQSFDCEFHECYGTSEIAIASSLDAHSARSKPESVGKAAPGVDIMIVGENAAALRSGAAGEIVCRTPMMFNGYFKLSELTRDSMWGEYFRTGDIGRLDEDGYLYFLGRRKDIIISGGINVYPADIEAVVNAHASVLESAAFAFPDERLGEVVAIALVARDERSFDLRELRFHCCAHLSDFQQPRKFFLLPELPKNGMGKLMKFELIDRLVGAPGQAQGGNQPCKA